MASSREAHFQKDIIAAMAQGGWLTGAASGYDRKHALYTEDLLGYVRDAWPERWDKFCKANPQAPEQAFVQKTVRELERAGTLEVLRHGFKVPGITFDPALFTRALIERSEGTGCWHCLSGFASSARVAVE